MELAEKMDTGHNQTKKRRQSSENVSDMLSVKILTVVSTFFFSSFHSFDCFTIYVEQNAPNK